MAALPEINPDDLSGRARELYEELIEKRGRIDGMYRTLLHHPDLLEPVAAMGTFLRFGKSVLPDDIRELAVLHLAQKLQAGYEWCKHVEPARKAGVPESVIEALRNGTHPAGLSSVQVAVLTALDHALVLQSIPASVQETVAGEFGDKGVLEVVALCGFYRFIAGVLYCFDIPLPEGAADPFND